MEADWHLPKCEQGSLETGKDARWGRKSEGRFDQYILHTFHEIYWTLLKSIININQNEIVKLKKWVLAEAPRYRYTGQGVEWPQGCLQWALYPIVTQAISRTLFIWPSYCAVCQYNLGCHQTSVDSPMCVQLLACFWCTPFRGFIWGRKEAVIAALHCTWLMAALGSSSHAHFSLFFLCSSFHSHTNTDCDSYAVQVLEIRSFSCCP